jgi:homoserine O-acetyltransferase/O-succinyltransferase
MFVGIKNHRLNLILFLVISLCFWGNAWALDAPLYAHLGDFKLENGSVLHNCRLAYRTAGVLNAEKSNVILVSTWLAGNSQDLIKTGFIGPGKVFDSSRYFVIAADAFGNGFSSSPSNSAEQPGTSFPQFSIRDLVRAQHILLTRTLNISHVRAVAGISMGAMTAFQWMVSYPGFMDLAIPVCGSPWLTSYEMLFWSAQMEILENVGACKGNKAAMKVLTPLFVMLAWSPDYRAAKTSLNDFPSFLAAEQEKFSQYDAVNWSRQITAIKNHNILKDFEGSGQKTAAAVRAKSLVITSGQDSIIRNEETKSFARLIAAKSAELNGACGHFSFLCDQENLKYFVHAFLSEN